MLHNEAGATMQVAIYVNYNCHLQDDGIKKMAISQLKRHYSKTCVKRPLSKRQLSLNAGQKYCRMLKGEHSAILPTFIKLPFVIKIYFCLFLSGRFTQVQSYINKEKLGTAHEMVILMAYRTPTLSSECPSSNSSADLQKK